MMPMLTCWYYVVALFIATMWRSVCINFILLQWEDMCAVETAHLPGHRSMNPCPVYNNFTGQVFLFFIAVLGRTTESYQIITGHNLARLCYVTSSDQGRSWSDVTDLTCEVIGESLKEWATFALGPGHGIQLKTGRLLVPAYTYHINCRDCFGKLCRTSPRAFTFRSDDHGKTWAFGELIPNLQTVECQLVSVDEEDGTDILYCNARSSLGFRVQALSSDGGIVFQPGQLVEKLVETPSGCHGSVIGFPAPINIFSRLNINNLLSDKSRNAIAIAKTLWKTKRVYQRQNKSGNILQPCLLNSDSNVCKLIPHKDTLGREVCAELSSISGLAESGIQTEIVYNTTPNFQTPTWVLYSHPTSAQSRMNLGVYLSPYPKDTDSWAGPWVIYEGPSAYSDLAYIELTSNGTMESSPVVCFACLFENGINTPYEQISFSIFTLYEVIQSLPPNPLFRQSVNKGRIKGNCKTS